MDNKSNLYNNLIINRHLQRKNISKQSQEALKRVQPACDTMLNICLSLIDRSSGKSIRRDHRLTPSIFLSAQFLQGEDVTRTSILEGAYHQAANLLKQETEILAAMDEVQNGTRIDGRSAKFRGEMKKIGRKYGELNDIAHPTRADVVELITSKIEGSKVDPTLEIQFNKELCLNFFGYHSFLVAKFTEKLRNIFVGTLGFDVSEEDACLMLDAVKILEAEGAFSIQPNL